MSIGQCLGKLDPHPEDTHPRVKLGNHMTVAKLSPTPAVVDYASKVRSWPVYMNNRLGDCTCAAIAHSIQAWTAYAKGLITLPDSAVLSLYEAMGYVPGDPSTDRGVVEQDLLNYVRKNGIGGHKILAFAQVDHKNPDEMKTALNMFGSLYLGSKMPQSALDQNNAGQPWSVVGGSPVLGGHAYVAQRWDVSAAPMEVVTWGQLQPVTMDFWLSYAEEAWVIITEDWFLANGKSVSGLDLTQLGDEFALLTGEANPFRKAISKPWYCTGLTEKIATRLDSLKHRR